MISENVKEKGILAFEMLLDELMRKPLSERIDCGTMERVAWVCEYAKNVLPILVDKEGGNSCGQD